METFALRLPMISLICFSLALNLNGGYETPIVAFKDINYGVNVGIGIETKALFFNICPGVKMDYYAGNNERYSVMNYEFNIALYKSNWIVSPFMSMGGSYLKRSFVDNAEIGYAFVYQAGGQLKISMLPINIYLRGLYHGLTDFNEHGGFIGYQMGFSYYLKDHERKEY